MRDGRGGYGVLRGPTPQAQPYAPADPAALARAFAAGDAVALVRGNVALPLWPLALYGAPLRPTPCLAPTTATSSSSVYSSDDGLLGDINLPTFRVNRARRPPPISTPTCYPALDWFHPPQSWEDK